MAGMEFTALQRSLLLDIARWSIRQQLSQQDLPPVRQSDPAFEQPASCFVTLHTLHTLQERRLADASGRSVPPVRCWRA